MKINLKITLNGSLIILSRLSIKIWPKLISSQIAMIAINYPWDNYLWTYCVFKRNQYLYFIDSSDALMRIDTKLKIIEAFDIPNEILS